MKPTGLFPLVPSFHETVWGSTDLAPWFESQSCRIGEVWFEHPDLPGLPVLVKFIFTTDRLSVQVHPDDHYARTHEGAPGGKTEMWYVLRAQPEARLAMGFKEVLSRERAREAALSGEIENLLQWFPVQPGDVCYIPAGTVHALGSGLVVCEIQQNNQITYRLYDYGRPRPLHLDKALDVAVLAPHSGPSRPTGSLLVSCPYFTVERVLLEDARVATAFPGVGDAFLVMVRGTATLNGQDLHAGQVWYLAGYPHALRLASEATAEVLLARFAIP